MTTRFKPLLAAAVAAGLVPAFDGSANKVEAATLAGFTFEGLTSSPGAVSSFSYAGESGGTLTLLKTAASGSISTVAGNGSTKSLTGNNLIGSSVTAAFTLDQWKDIAVSFDETGSGTGPANFVVSYSYDNTNFTSFGSFSIQSTGSSGFSSGTFNTAVNKSFVLPSDFSDVASAVGELGYIQIAVSGTAAINGASTGAGTGGTNRIDNLFITGSAVPEPVSASVMTIAAAGLCLRRRSRKA